MNILENDEMKFLGKNYGEFKKYTAEIVINKLESIQKRYYQLLGSKELDEILDNGVKKSKELAKIKFDIMKNKMGLER